MTGRVQFREDESKIAFVRELGVNPNELARELFEKEVRRLRAKERHDELTQAAIHLPRPAAEIVREDRDR